MEPNEERLIHEVIDKLTELNELALAKRVGRLFGPTSALTHEDWEVHYRTGRKGITTKATYYFYHDGGPTGSFHARQHAAHMLEIMTDISEGNVQKILRKQLLSRTIWHHFYDGNDRLIIRSDKKVGP